MLIALFLIGLIAMAAVVLFCALKAPKGYEDERGFHFDLPKVRADDLPSLQNRITASIVFLQFRWAKPALGLAVLFVMLLVLSPAAHDNNTNKTPTPTGAVLKPSEFGDSASTVKATVSGGESSQIFQTLCQRFNQIE
jgi:hypothetical protein